MVYFIEIILSFRAADNGSVSRARSGSGLVTSRAGPRTSLDSGYSLFQNIPKFLLHNTTMYDVLVFFHIKELPSTTYYQINLIIFFSIYE